MQPRKLILLFALILPITLTSCGGSNPVTVGTPAPVNSPQTQVLNVTKTLADSINAAVKTAIALQGQGTISVADTQTVVTWAKASAILDDQIATELGSADAWTLQKKKIVASLAGFKLPQVTSNPTLQLALQQVLVLVQQIQLQVTAQ